MKKLIIVTLIFLALLAGSIFLYRREAVAPAKTEPRTNTQTTQPMPTLDSPAAFDKTKYSTNDPSSIWVVVNKQRPLSPKDYAPKDLVSVGGGQQMRKEAANALAKMIANAKTEKLSIQALSGYRSYGTQVSVYNNEVTANGQAIADTQSARPGISEHQTGFAVDVGGGGCGIEDCFGNTAEGKWVAANAYKYGFIVRYTVGSESVTGYRAEPWHLRYIGTELSAELHKQNILTLEEFFGLPGAPDY